MARTAVINVVVIVETGCLSLHRSVPPSVFSKIAPPSLEPSR
jgi:hypothetical protein